MRELYVDGNDRQLSKRTMMWGLAYLTIVFNKFLTFLSLNSKSIIGIVKILSALTRLSHCDPGGLLYHQMICPRKESVTCAISVIVCCLHLPSWALEIQ